MTRVLTLPGRHAYLDGALPPEVVRVVGGRPDDLGFGPDPLWEPAALAAVLPGVDAVHVHFGFDHVDPGVLAAWCAALRRADMPLVVTVHDLRNPHHPRPDRHAAQLRVLLAHAAAVLTLTTAAAAQVRRTYGATAAVVPHPAVFPGPAPDVPTEAGLVGLHLKSLRANVIDLPAVVAAVAAGADRAGGRLAVWAHRDVADRIRDLGIAVHPHDRLDHEGLRRRLTGLHALVLPQRFGTHSGLVEACRDVGTAAVVPSSGCQAAQWPAAYVYRHDERDGLSSPSLAAAVGAALGAAVPAPVEAGLRSAQSRRSHAVHRALYAAVRRPVLRAS